MKNFSMVFISISLVLFIVFGCGPKVMVPPVIDLEEYEVIGLIEFTSNVEGNLNEYATQKFLEAITVDQKGIRIVELGSESEILELLDADRVNPETIKSIGKKYNLRTVIAGDLDVSDIRPMVNLLGLTKFVTFKAEVDATIAVKMFETIDGATIWTNSEKGTAEVAHVSLISGDIFSFDATNPDEAYGDLVEKLVWNLTRDFRVTYKRI